MAKRKLPVRTEDPADLGRAYRRWLHGLPPSRSVAERLAERELRKRRPKARPSGAADGASAPPAPETAAPPEANRGPLEVVIRIVVSGPEGGGGSR